MSDEGEEGDDDDEEGDEEGDEEDEGEEGGELGTAFLLSGDADAAEADDGEFEGGEDEPESEVCVAGCARRARARCAPRRALLRF